MAALPQEVMEEILARLPMKSLRRFKAASKKCYSLIFENHKFAELNLKHSLSSSKHLIFYQLITLDGDIFRYSDVDSYESRTINFPIEIGRRQCRLVGSVNGLICVALPDCWDCCCIWNPYTGEYKRIQIPIPVDHYCLLGFGYDSISDDYKILGVWHSYLHIFSLKTNSWKRLEYSFEYGSAISSVHSNGALYWSIGRKITAFDLAKEETTFLDFPEGINFVNGNFPSVPLLDYEGSLCIYDHKSIWVMKEYNNSKYWAKLTPSLPNNNAKPVLISRLGKAVFLAKGGLGSVKSDIQGRMPGDDFFEKIMSGDDKAGGDEPQIIAFGDAFVYTESLLSPKFFD